MKTATLHTRRLSAAALTLSAVALLGGCVASDDSATSNNPGNGGNNGSFSGPVTPTESFAMPELTPDGAGGYTLAPATDGNFPAVPAIRVLKSGDRQGATESSMPAKVASGDLVQIRWKMYSLRSGEIVENSDEILENEPAEVVVGGGKGGTVNVPAPIHEALEGQRVGDTVQVLFQYGMPDLPPYLNADDAYTLVVDVVAKI